MADTVTSNVIANTRTRYVVHLTNVSDGTGEAAVIKVDKSTLVASDGAEPASLDIERVDYCVNGMAVTLAWDHTTDDTALVLAGNGGIDFRGVGVVPDLDGGVGNLRDPRSAGGTGDLLLTTTGHTAGDTYDITLWLRKQPD